MDAVQIQRREVHFPEAQVERLVDERRVFHHLDTCQLLIEDFEARAMWVFE